MFALVSVWFLDSALVILGFYIGIYVFYIWSNVSCIRDSAQFCQDMKFVQKDVMIVAAFSWLCGSFACDFDDFPEIPKWDDVHGNLL